MPSNSPSLRDRYLADLRSGSLPVLVTAVALALVALLASVTSVDSTVAFVLTFAIALLVPAVHERYWPQDRPVHRDVAWALVAGLAVAAVVLGSALALESLLEDPTLAAALSFLVAVVLTFAVGRWLGGRLGRTRHSRRQ